MWSFKFAGSCRTFGSVCVQHRWSAAPGTQHEICRSHRPVSRDQKNRGHGSAWHSTKADCSCICGTASHDTRPEHLFNAPADKKFSGR